ncbi:MAG: 4-hydroxy-tetrahydrodipicolinate synthase [Firmicutes bacterium]|nr:4-hydroxy-tetrahydrodipicolinate synthase [Bacillota bacterium]
MIKGSIVALVTPFSEDGSVNYFKLGELIEWHISNKTDAILILGTTGESSTMSHEEDEEVCRFTVNKVAGRVPVIAGSGSNSTETMLNKSLQFERCGADALLLISPYYNKANDEGMYLHFKTVADAVNIPCILYNVPGRTSCSIPVDVVRRLSEHKNIVGIKEASGNVGYATKISKLINDDFVMYNGNDDITLPMLSLGAVGVISVFANICPRETHDMVMSFLNDRPQESLRIQQKYLDLINALFVEVNPIPVKEALNMMGFEVGGYRLPLYKMSDEHRAFLREKMIEVGVIG